MEELFMKVMNGFDLQNIAAFWLILWWMLRPIKAEIKEIKEEIKDLDRRLCRIEGALSSKDCCMLKNEQTLRKVE